MNLHEYQAKKLFKEFGIAVLDGQLAQTPAEAVEKAKQLGGSGWVVKAQVHAGGRGKAGGVKLAKSLDEVQQYASDMIGNRLATKQTGEAGLIINSVLIEPTCEIASELYVSAVVDRAAQRVSIIASAAGGMDIEEVAATQPEKLIKIRIDPVVGLMPYQCRQVAFALGFGVEQIKPLSKVLNGVYSLFSAKDASLIEINPLIVTKSGDILALDAKINIDDNGLYRQAALAEMRDPTQENALEVEAQKHELNYISLSGNIGCMVNGAGLAMATMDLIKLHGGDPANFLDVGGGATAERVAEAFKLILSDSKVKAILVNIFGGIVRCDLIAEGIIKAVQEVHVEVPVVVRLEGTNVDKGREMLTNSGLQIIATESLTDAAEKVVGSAVGRV
jgi:succinyl-CoA synthetase beta subunit